MSRSKFQTVQISAVNIFHLTISSATKGFQTVFFKTENYMLLLVWAEGADLCSSRCCQIQEVLHSSCWNLKFHLLQLPMWRGGHRKILLAPFSMAWTFKTNETFRNGGALCLTDVSPGGPGAEPAAASTCLTVRGDVQAGFSCWLRVWKHSRSCCCPLNITSEPQWSSKTSQQQRPTGVCEAHALFSQLTFTVIIYSKQHIRFF